MFDHVANVHIKLHAYMRRTRIESDPFAFDLRRRVHSMLYPIYLFMCEHMLDRTAHWYRLD